MKKTQSVAKMIDPRFAERMDAEILGIPADSVVGAAVVDLCSKAVALIDFEASDGGCVEREFVTDIVSAVVGQCSVWYFG